MRMTGRVRWIAFVAVLGWGMSVSQAQTVVAKIKVHNPAAQEMKDVIVRGMLPAPADMTKPVEALAVREGGKVVPTQVAVFSTYPGSDDKHPVGKPEVVQLIFRGTLPANGFKEFEVVQLDAAPPTAASAVTSQPGKTVAAWLAGKAPVVVEATDCFGNRYCAAPLDKANLVESRVAGGLLTEQVYQATMAPVGAAKTASQPAMKQFFRVRAYLTQYAGEEFAALSLVIHNGSADAPSGPRYYGEIRVGVAQPLGLEVWQKGFSPAADASAKSEGGYLWQPCPAADKDGKFFVMPAKGAAVLRTFVYAPAAKDRAVQYAGNYPIFIPVPSQELYSWSNFATARYGGSKYPMPFNLGPSAVADAKKEAARDTSATQLDYLKNAPAGTSRLLGHAMPFDAPYGGVTGGGGIFYVYGVHAAVTGLNDNIKAHVMVSDRYWDRHHAYAFHDNGKLAVRGVAGAAGTDDNDVGDDNGDDPPSKAVTKKPAAPVAPVVATAPAGADPAAKVQADYVVAGNRLSPAAQTLLKYHNQDDQHLARMMDMIPAAYLACDPVARDRIVMIGSQASARMKNALEQAKKAVQANPHTGVENFGRAHGWLLHAAAAAFFVSQDKDVRQACLGTAKLNAEVMELAQRPDGVIAIHRPFSKILDGGYWAVHTWQAVGIMADGNRAAVAMLRSPDTQKLADGLAQVYAKCGKWGSTAGWSDKSRSPANAAGLRKKDAKEDLPQPFIPDDVVKGFINYYGCPFTWYYEVTGDKQFLARLTEMAGGNIEKCALNKANLPMWSYALWLAQGGKIPGREGLAAPKP